MDDEGGHATQGKPVAFGCGDGHDEPAAQQSIVFSQGLNQGVVLGYPGRPTSLGVPPESPPGGLAQRRLEDRFANPRDRPRLRCLAWMRLTRPAPYRDRTRDASSIRPRLGGSTRSFTKASQCLPCSFSQSEWVASIPYVCRFSMRPRGIPMGSRQQGFRSASSRGARSPCPSECLLA